MKSKLFFLVTSLLMLTACQSVSQQPERSFSYGAPLQDAEVASLGWIEGSVSYPAEGIPDDLQVCAIEVTEFPVAVCTKDFIQDEKYTYGVGYKIAVSPGIYHIEARRPNNPLKGLYTEFIPCGQRASCKDHTVLDVVVQGGRVTAGVDPGDWYAN